MHLELYYCSRKSQNVQKWSLSGKNDRMFNKTLASFPNKWTWLISSRMCTKMWLLLKKSPNFLIWAFFGKTDRSLEKKNVLKTFGERLIAQVSFQMRLENYYCLCHLKMFKTLGFLEKEMFFCEKKHNKVFKHRRDGFFL